MYIITDNYLKDKNLEQVLRKYNENFKQAGRPDLRVIRYFNSSSVFNSSVYALISDNSKDEEAQIVYSKEDQQEKLASVYVLIECDDLSYLTVLIADTIEKYGIENIK